MKPTAHVYTSAIMATVLYAHSHSVPESTVCFVSGVLIDLDHVVDYFLFSPRKISLERFLSWFEYGWHRVTLVFHSYELFSLLLVAAFYLDSPLLRGIFWGTGLHLLLDQIWNLKKYKLSPWFYFLVFRISAGFRREKMQASPHG